MTADTSLAGPGFIAPTAIAVAPNGGRRGKNDHPALPIGPEELASTAAACLEAGAAMIHAHVRDRDGGHLLDADAYREATKAIRDAVGERLVIQITSEAVGRYQAGRADGGGARHPPRGGVAGAARTGARRVPSRPLSRTSCRG